MNNLKISSFSVMPVFKRNMCENFLKDCCPPRKIAINLERTPAKDVFKKA